MRLQVDDGVLELLGDASPDYGARRNRDGFAGCRIPAAPRFPPVQHEPCDAGEREFTGLEELLLAYPLQLVEELARVSALEPDIESSEVFDVMRQQVRLAHLSDPDIRPALSAAGGRPFIGHF